MAAHGYKRMILEQIGEAVGLSPTRLYHYVGDKKDILARLMVDSTEAIARDADALSGGGRAAGRGDRRRGRLRRHRTPHHCAVCAGRAQRRAALVTGLGDRERFGPHRRPSSSTWSPGSARRATRPAAAGARPGAGGPTSPTGDTGTAPR